MICAGGKGHAIYKGDSGGPLIDAQTKALIGIVSANK
jgi:secreted trypsin-like serine protease